MLAAIVNKSAIARVLGIKTTALVGYEIQEKRVVAKLKAGERTIEFQQLVTEFAEYRKRSAKDMVVQPMHSHVYAVYNPKKSTSYEVRTKPDGVYCRCWDWTINKGLFGKSICKHSYSVLFALGFVSLQQYLAEQNQKETVMEELEPLAEIDFEALKMWQLKDLALRWGVFPTGDKRFRLTWIGALKSAQRSSKVVEMATYRVEKKAAA